MVSSASLPDPHTAEHELKFAAFYVDELLLAIPIEQVEEIVRLGSLTPVPHAPAWVRGVMNLRGEVITVLDLRAILGLGAAECSARTRNVIVQAHGERIGLLVDRISDVIQAPAEELLPPPANVAGADGRYVKAVFRLAGELMIVLDVAAATDIHSGGKQELRFP